MRGPVAFLFVSLALVAGCGMTTLRDVEDAHTKGAGTTRLYAVRQDKALTVTMDVLRQAGAEDVTANTSADSTRSVPGEVLATVKGFSVSFVGVWLSPQDTEHTNVTVVSKGASSVAVAHQLGEEAFHEKFAASLGGAAPMTTSTPPGGGEVIGKRRAEVRGGDEIGGVVRGARTGDDQSPSLPTGSTKC